MTDDSRLPPKQLRMVAQADDILRLPDPVVPNGYLLRGYRRGDGVSWIRTLNLGGFIDWDLDRVVGYLSDPERRQRSRVVEHRGGGGAATFASRRSDREGALDFAVTLPRHRRLGLGRATCTGVAKFLVDRGC